MTKVDQFESVFKSAARSPFVRRPVEIESVLVVTDRDRAGADAFLADVRGRLGGVVGPGATWRALDGGEFGSVRELLDQVESLRPGLICAYRNLHSGAWRWPFSLGEYIDVLTQATTTPVLLFPHPEAGVAMGAGAPRSVMALTDHLAGDDRLVSYAARFTAEGGRLHLTHVEDEVAFERFLDAISKVPSIDTDEARELILERLLKDPADYIASCRRVLAEDGAPCEVVEHVGLGHQLRHCMGLLEEHDVELLVLNTKDADQLAMHGLAYPLAVEAREIALLMV